MNRSSKNCCGASCEPWSCRNRLVDLMNVILDIGAGGKIIGIEILDASLHLDLERLLPVRYGASKAG